MSFKSSKRAILSKLIKEHKGKCQCCNRQVIQPVQGCGDAVFKDDTATIEHIYSRYDIRRLLVKDNECLTLYCMKCNNLKARNEIQAMHKIHSGDSQYKFKIVSLLLPVHNIKEFKRQLKKHFAQIEINEPFKFNKP